MAYVIAEPCIGTKDNSCVEVCPVDCIHPTTDEPDYDKVEMLYIDPEECIDCDACVEACPVDACFAEDQLPEEWTKFTADQRRVLLQGRLTVPRRALLAVCAVAALTGLGAPAARAAVPADSVGIYSEEHERANSSDRMGVGAAQHAAGVGLVRQPFLWSRIETAPGVLDYSVYDDVVASAAVAGMTVLPVILDAPPWRSAGPAVAPGEDMYPPAQADAFAVLAGLLVHALRTERDRSGPPIPICPTCRSTAGRSGTSPTRCSSGRPVPIPRRTRACCARRPARSARPIPPPRSSPAGLPESLGGTPVGRYLDGMYAAGARGTFDTLAIHPYARDAEGALDILRSARADLDRHGDAQKPIWATEFGWASGGPASLVTTTEASQAARVRDTIVLMQRARSALRLRGFVVFRWADKALNAGQKDSWPLHTGLLRADGSAKPALDAFRYAVSVWRQEPSPELAEKPASAGGPSSSSAAAARALKIGRYVSRGRLYVRVDVAPGRGGKPVRITYRALRKARVRVTRSRSVGTRKRVARVVFKLPRSARSADLLRIVATQGSARATRDLRLRLPRRPPIRQRAAHPSRRRALRGANT